MPGFEHIASLFTIHNMAYQGQFWHWDMLLTGLDWKYFNWQQMEFFGNLNLMKTGPRVRRRPEHGQPALCREIQGPAGLRARRRVAMRRDVLSGIINGVDYSEWNPAADPHLPANYDATRSPNGKAACKARCKANWACRSRPDVPLVGFVGRLVEQKGIDLVAP